MGQFFHAGDRPVFVDGIGENEDVFPGGMVHPGQVIPAESNPDEDVFRDVTPSEPEPTKVPDAVTGDDSKASAKSAKPAK